MSSDSITALKVGPGDVLANKYRVERILGVGGMGVVVAARHEKLDELVALKFLKAKSINNPEAKSRFLQEARAAAKIKSEHVARVSDFGELESGAPYIVMEYLEGVDLAGWLARTGPLPVSQAVDFILQACDAIAEAHALGIVHRDLKPENLFCISRPDGRIKIKVLDFGISKTTVAGASNFNKTRTAAVMGSPLYMSPEQLVQSNTVDGRTDIWSLGIILFEVLTGKVPFDSEVLTALTLKICQEPAPTVRSLRKEVPFELSNVIARCLDKDRLRRFADITELATALGPYGPPNAVSLVQRIAATARGEGRKSFPFLLPLEETRRTPVSGLSEEIAKKQTLEEEAPASEEPLVAEAKSESRAAPEQAPSIPEETPATSTKAPPASSRNPVPITERPPALAMSRPPSLAKATALLPRTAAPARTVRIKAVSQKTVKIPARVAPSSTWLGMKVGPWHIVTLVALCAATTLIWFFAHDCRF